VAFELNQLKQLHGKSYFVMF